MFNPKIAYHISKQVCKHPAETLAAAESVVATVAPVVLPLAVVAGIGYGIYWLCKDGDEA